ncbi:MAG: hypothetical protein QXL15_02750 [Candidatus Korarchaeota archaeon]
MWYDFSSIGMIPLPERETFSPDRRYRYAINGKIVHILDGRSNSVTPAVIKILAGHTDLVTDVDWSPDGAHIVTVGMDKRIIIWNVSDWTASQVILSRIINISAVSWRPGTTEIVTGTNDGTIALWHIPTAEILRLFDAGFPVKGLYWLDRDILVARGREIGENRIWAYLVGIEKVRLELAEKAGIQKTAINRIENLLRMVVLKGLGKNIFVLRSGLDIPLADAMHVVKMLEVVENYKFPCGDESIVQSADLLSFLVLKRLGRTTFNLLDIINECDLQYLPAVLVLKYLEELKSRKITLKSVEEKYIEKARKIIESSTDKISSPDDFLKLSLKLNVTPRTAKMILHNIF